jgi:hypothetical protein
LDISAEAALQGSLLLFVYASREFSPLHIVFSLYITIFVEILVCNGVIAGERYIK